MVSESEECPIGGGWGFRQRFPVFVPWQPPGITLRLFVRRGRGINRERGQVGLKSNGGGKPCIFGGGDHKVGTEVEKSKLTPVGPQKVCSDKTIMDHFVVSNDDT